MSRGGSIPVSAIELSVDNKLLDGFLAPFFEIDGFCKRDCTACDYCDSFAEKCFGTEEARRIAETAIDAIRGMEPFG